MTVEQVGTAIIVASGGASAALAATALYTPRALRDGAERVGQALREAFGAAESEAGEIEQLLAKIDAGPSTGPGQGETK